MSTIFRKEKFHKKELVPIEFLEDTENARSNLKAYLAGRMRSWMFSPGQQVTHVQNLNKDHIMFVRKAVYKEVEKNGKVETLFDGIECHWWE